MRHRIWVEFLADYDCEISYHPRKENVVANAFSSKELRVLYHLNSVEMVVILGIFEQLQAA